MSEEQPKYLAVKNWHKYQGRHADGRPLSWIKSYTDRDLDPEYSRLTQAQRYLLDGCIRLRGRFGKNLPNDHVWVSRALGIVPKERTCVPHNVHVLTTLGFLVPTNQQLDLEQTDREEKRREEKNREERKQKRHQDSASADGRFSACRDYAYRWFINNQNQKPSWAKKDYSQLALLLKRKPDISPPDFETRWTRYVEGTGWASGKEQGFSLSFFCSQYDRFLKETNHEVIEKFFSQDDSEVA